MPLRTLNLHVEYFLHLDILKFFKSFILDVLMLDDPLVAENLQSIVILSVFHHLNDFVFPLKDIINTFYLFHLVFDYISWLN